LNYIIRNVRSTNYDLLKLHLEIIQYFSKSIFRRNKVDDILWDIASNLIHRLDFVDCVIYVLDRERQVLVQKAAYGKKNIDNIQIADPIEIVPGKGIVGAVAVSGKPEIIDNCDLDNRYIVDDARRLSEICVPIYYEDEIIGVIDSEHPDAGFYTPWHLEVLESIAAISATKIAKTLVEEKNEVIARFFDESPNPFLRANIKGSVLNSNTAARSLPALWRLSKNVIGNKSILHEIKKSLNEKKVRELDVQIDDRQLALRFIPFESKGYVNIYSSDITKIKIAQQIAEKSSKAKDEFLSVMSHEIRTPLHAILGVTSLLHMTSLTSKQTEYVSTLEFAGNNLLDQVNDILDLEKIAAGKVTFSKTPFNLKETVIQVIQTFNARAAERKNKLTLIFDENIPLVIIGDQRKLVQVINNLISNAIKFTLDGLIEISIQLKSNLNDRITLTIQVSDNGAGIPIEKQSRVFQAFEQAEFSTSRAHGGSGLGLTIARKLVELQGGWVKLTSEPGRGTTITLNLSFDTTQAKVLSGIVDQELNQNRTLKNYKVLVVDDNPINLMIAQQFLLIWEMNVRMSNNGLEAIKDYEDFDPDIILMDLHMPECDGYEASRRIRKIERNTHKTIPIIALSADVVSRSRENAISAGMNDIVSKPFKPQTLLAAISRHLFQV
jgi:signal transduction histidine kinase/ActR/RegA family two-component response regulator